MQNEAKTLNLATIPINLKTINLFRLPTHT